ncbi:class I adenylate-forming enzyme family protein [Streptomyces sp. AK010]|uniref:AMP-binding protein n=1 Tax=Streptomyces sp. AK010 TaxID=2723074 RepID=UPI00160D9FFF|nr:class I adenylate-forming enzyme family protein [Streptomyces sp. AK010]MBB6421399.1 acyl-coenzyme A synthetase/AMP-(fatty) acid ligase [Streptomyces sp. AK010]
MTYSEMTPEKLLSLGFTSPDVADGAWVVRWDRADGQPEELIRGHLPPTIDFHTSGSTGPSQCWRRLRENVWLEAGLLADLVADEEPEAVVSFVPPVHLYGALASVVVPARMGLPVWYRSSFAGRMPDTGCGRVVVAATPWIFSLLLQHMDWVEKLDHLTVLYGGALLPDDAHRFLAAAGPERALLVEVLGSTEAGGTATRRWRGGEPPHWTLFPDVSFADSVPIDPAGEEEVPLAVRSPRLAFRPGGSPPAVFEGDDQVTRTGERTFRFAGRRGRLVKVNGRRVNLDEMENALRALIDCRDLAIRPVTDSMIGEHFELLLVLHPGVTLADTDLTAGYQRLGIRPKRVRVLNKIERSALGKVRHAQNTSMTDVKD